MRLVEEGWASVKSRSYMTNGHIWPCLSPFKSCLQLWVGEYKLTDCLLLVKSREEQPLRQIANNAGTEGSVVIDKVKNGEGAFGSNADTDT